MPPEPMTPTDAELRTALHEPARPEFLAALDDRMLDAINAEREVEAGRATRLRFGLPRFALPALGAGALAAVVVAVVLSTGGSSSPAPGLRASAHPSAPPSAAESAPAAAGGTSSSSAAPKGDTVTVAPLRVLPSAGPGEIHLGYTVVTPGRLRVTLRRIDSGLLLRRSVALDPGTGTVVLRLTDAPTGRYRLHATGALTLRATVRVR